MALSLALRNKQMLVLIAVALLTLLVITTFVLSATAHIDLWNIFSGKAVINRYS